MPSKDPIQRFEDILDNAILILEFTKGMDLNFNGCIEVGRPLRDWFAAHDGQELAAGLL